MKQGIDITPTQLIAEDAPYGKIRNSRSHSIIPSQLHQTQNPIIGDNIARKMKEERVKEPKRGKKIKNLNFIDESSHDSKTQNESQIIILEEEDSQSDGSSSSHRDVLFT